MRDGNSVIEATLGDFVLVTGRVIPSLLAIYVFRFAGAAFVVDAGLRVDDRCLVELPGYGGFLGFINIARPRADVCFSESCKSWVRLFVWPSLRLGCGYVKSLGLALL